MKFTLIGAAVVVAAAFVAPVLAQAELLAPCPIYPDQLCRTAHP